MSAEKRGPAANRTPEPENDATNAKSNDATRSRDFVASATVNGTPEFVQRGPFIRKPGPKPDPLRAEVRAMFPEWSDRTFATYWRGVNSHLDLVRSA